MSGRLLTEAQQQRAAALTARLPSGVGFCMEEENHGVPSAIGVWKEGANGKVKRLEPIGLFATVDEVHNTMERVLDEIETGGWS